MHHARIGSLALCLSLDFLATQGLAAAGKPTTMLVEEATDELAFLARAIGGVAR